jgi:DNA-binding transcriptional ArsR family regulator
MNSFEKLEPMLLSQPRLMVMSILYKQNEAEFSMLKKITKMSAGNLSVQINNLSKVGYIEVVKQFKGNYPLTICKITNKGIFVFEDFFKSLNTYLVI